MITSKLTSNILIKQLVVSATTEGIAINVWLPVKKLAVTITNQRGDLAFNSSYLGDVYSDNVSFYSRYAHILKKENQKSLRIEFQGRDYEIINITTVARNKATVIDCMGVK